MYLFELISNKSSYMYRKTAEPSTMFNVGCFITCHLKAHICKEYVFFLISF